MGCLGEEIGEKRKMKKTRKHGGGGKKSISLRNREKDRN